MNQAKSPPPVSTFADFMYAVVIGVAFSDVRLFGRGITAESLFVTFFLLIVVLEDFYMYQTQVKPYSDIFTFTTASSLLFEVLILLSWFVAFLSRSESAKIAFIGLAAFFLLKWLASAKHLFRNPSSWVLNRDHLFWLMIGACLFMAFHHIARVVSVFGVVIAANWATTAILWLAQTLAWWALVSCIKGHEQ